MTAFKDLDFSDKSVLKEWYKSKTEEEICGELIFNEGTNINITYLYLFLSGTENLINVITGILSLLIGSSIWPIITNLVTKYSDYVKSGMKKDNFTLTGMTQSGPKVEGYMSIPTQVNVAVMTVLSVILIGVAILYITDVLPMNRKRKFVKKYIDLNKSA